MPFGNDYETVFYELPYRSANDNPLSIVDLVSQGIDAARDVARGALSDHVYPDDPRYRPNVTVYPQPSPQPGSQPAPQPGPGVQPQPSGGLTLSTNTLIILGLVGFAFVFGRGKK